MADRTDLAGAISRLVEDDDAYLLNFNIDETDMVFPMTPGGAGVDEILLNATERYIPE